MAAAALSAIRDLLPSGGTLDHDAFVRRQRWLVGVLAAHVPALVAFGVARGFGALHLVAVVIGPAALAWIGGRTDHRRAGAAAVAAGLALSSGALLHLADGAVEARFHVYVVVVVMALYHDWLPLFVVTAIGAAPVPWHGDEPGSWTAVHAVAVGAACIGQAFVLRAIQREERRNARLAAELAWTQSEVEARESMSNLLVNLARRNQALLDRQINLVVAMQERETDPDQLAELFELDHLATRVRRNGESLLVVSGDDPARRWGRPVALADVVRAAIAEVEDYRRADVVVDDAVAVAGRAVADVAHMLAELVENGMQFSPPDARVRIASRQRSDGGCTLVVEDRGIGMPAADLAGANELLAHAPEVDLRLSKRVGLHVISRLADRYGVRVALAPTPGGGVTATVVVPPDLLAPAEPATTARQVGAPKPSRASWVPTVAGRPLTAARSRPAIDPGFDAMAPRPVAVATPSAPRRSPEAVRSGLSRFQAAQARGREDARARRGDGEDA